MEREEILSLVRKYQGEGFDVEECSEGRIKVTRGKQVFYFSPKTFKNVISYINLNSEYFATHMFHYLTDTRVEKNCELSSVKMTFDGLKILVKNKQHQWGKECFKSIISEDDNSINIEVRKGFFLFCTAKEDYLYSIVVLDDRIYKLVENITHNTILEDIVNPRMDIEALKKSLGTREVYE